MAAIRTPKLRTAEGALITILSRKHGTLKKCADFIRNKLDWPEFNEQNLLNWRIRGKVPLNVLLMVSKAFNVSPFLLNYKGYKAVSTERAKKYKTYLDECDSINSMEKAFIYKYIKEE